MDIYQLVVGNEDCPFKTVVSVVIKSALIRNEWSKFAIQLGVPYEQIESFRQGLLLKTITVEEIIYKVLVVWKAENGSKATLATLLQVTEGHCGANDVGELLRLEYKLPCKEAEGTPSIQWTDLSPAFQKRVIETFRHFTPNLKHANVLPKLNGAALVSLMRGNKPHVLSLPEELRYYVSRTILTRNIISPKIFEQYSSDIFLFTGLDRYELSKLAKDKLTGSTREQLQGAPYVKFMILDQESHYERICEKTNHPFHLLRREGDGKLRWIKSNGEISNLRYYVEKEHDELDEIEFCKRATANSIPVLICDSPGMGKSVLLAQIGHTLVKKIHPEITVLFSTLSQFIKLAKSFGMKNKLKMVELTLQDLLGEGEALPQLNEKTVSFELLLDGYDEVDLADRKLALEILQTIRNSFKYIRIWVTSRPHLMDELENGLNVLGYNIRPFHEQNQVHFLSAFWSQKIQLDQEKVQLFAKNCLQSLKATMNSTDHDIAGIPLQCLLIGEIYEDDALEYVKLGKGNQPGDALQIKVGTFTNLYSQLVKKKFQKYKTTFGNPKLSEDELMTIHSHLSLEVLFPVEHGRLRLTKARETNMEEMMKGGILTSTRMDTITFLHRTFAEYFVAWFFFDKLQQEETWEPKMINLFFKITGCHDFFRFKFRETTKFTYEVICYFLNAMIASVHLKILPNNFPIRLKYNQLKSAEDIFFASINGSFVQIFKLLDTRGLFDKLPYYKFFTHRILDFSVRSSSVELVKSVLTHFERHGNYDFEVQKAVLVDAVIQGKFSIVEFLVKKKRLSWILEEDKTNFVCLCVHYTLDSSDEEIREKLQILQMLVGINRALLDNLDGDLAPLVSHQVHVKLLKELLRLGANVFVQDNEGNTVLHLKSFSRNMSPEDYHELVISISTDQFGRLVLLEGTFHDTAFMSILRKFDPLSETLDIFHGVGADFNHVNEKEDSVLGVAIKNARNPETIRKLIQLGANVSGIDKQGNTLLHLSAQSDRDNFSLCNLYVIIQLLLENGADPSAINDLNETSFHAFLRNTKAKSFKIFQLFKSKWDERSLWTSTIATLALVYAVDGDDHTFPDKEFESLAQVCESHRADFNWKDDEGRSLLHLAAKNGKTSTVKFLIKMGVNVNSKNDKGQSPLHVATSSKQNNCLNVIKCLIENEGNLMEITNHGQNILHWAASMGTAAALKYFLELGGADVNGKDSWGDTPLHNAIEYRDNLCGIDSLEKCRLLLQYGADGNSLNRFGSTPREMARRHQDKNKLLIKILCK